MYDVLLVSSSRVQLIVAQGPCIPQTITGSRYPPNEDAAGCGGKALQTTFLVSDSQKETNICVLQSIFLSYFSQLEVAWPVGWPELVCNIKSPEVLLVLIAILPLTLWRGSTLCHSPFRIWTLRPPVVLDPIYFIDHLSAKQSKRGKRQLHKTSSRPVGPRKLGMLSCGVCTSTAPSVTAAPTPTLR